jgi:hypothetical protein
MRLVSYDLFFRSSPAGKPINENTFREYFSNRPHYQIEKRQAWYSNEDTGVYFAFELSDPAEEPDGEPRDASFNLNYYRPHIFGMEAEPEVSGFVATFEPVITDPQIGGMADGEYSRDGFLRGWNTGNEFGYRTIGKAPHPPHLLSSVAIERFWRWNFERGKKQEDAGEGIFVPRVIFFSLLEGVASCVVWGDAIPILLPEVDFVVIVRDELAPRKFFKRKPDRALISWAQMLPAISSYSYVGDALPYHRLDFRAPPGEILSWIRGLSPHVGELTGIAAADVLDRELWAR